MSRNASIPSRLTPVDRLLSPVLPLPPPLPFGRSESSDGGAPDPSHGMNVPPLFSRDRVRVDGKFFRLGPTKFFPKGVTYGPFAPGEGGEFLPDIDGVKADFEVIRQLGANLLRLYHVPPRWFMDLAFEYQFKLLVDVPWNKHVCFLDDPEARTAARDAVRKAVRSCVDHPAVFAISVVNEIPTDIVRWSGANAVSEFLDDLIEVARQEDPECLYTFGNFPPTEFLRPRKADFHCWNLYLHQAEY